MEKTTHDKLRILHIGSDPEFLSPVIVDKYMVEIPTFDNIFTVCQWVSDNGLPDAIVCEQKLPAGDESRFHDFWLEHFDSENQIPFLLLNDEISPETKIGSTKNNIDNIFIKPITAETLVSRILTLKKEKSQDTGTKNKETIPFTRYKTPFLKRTFDIVSASLILLIISPFLLIFAIAIRLESKGRIYYVSKRLGTGYKVFDFFQLRTMYTYSDKRLKEIARLNQYVKEASSPQPEKTFQGAGNILPEANQIQDKKGKMEPAFMKFESNPRLTKVGHILRKLHFDELLQLFNVLKGDLSVVGNRPLKIYDAELLTTEDLINRMNGPAGITGLWKLRSRRRLKRMSSEERRALDNKYFKIAKRKFSFWSDLWIVARTIPVLLRRGNI